MKPPTVHKEHPSEYHRSLCGIRVAYRNERFSWRGVTCKRCLRCKPRKRKQGG